MAIVQILVLVGIFGLITFCSSRIANKTMVPLREKESPWTWPAGIGVFVVSFALISAGVLLAIAMTFGR